MKNSLVAMFLILGSASHAETAGNSKVAVAPTESARLFRVQLRSGLMLSNPDEAVLSKWEHRPLESFKHALSASVAFPPSWQQVRFMAGTEFQYITMKEELSGAYTATIDTTIAQFLVFGGVEFRPYWANGFGAGLTTGWKIRSEKKAKLDAQGFTQDLGTEEANDGMNAIIFPMIFSASVFYQVEEFRPSLTIETDGALTLGVSYAF
jgi:hypothetical protein